MIYAVFPHGHYSLTHLFYFALNPKYGNVRPAIHSFIFWIPIFSTMARWIEAIGFKEQEMLDTLQKHSIIMCPEGIRGVIQDDVKHRGFLRVARNAGVKVVPVWCSQERNYYRHFLPLGRLLEPYLTLPLPIIIWGRTFLPLFPRAPPNNEVRFGEIHDPEKESDDEFWEKLQKLK